MARIVPAKPRCDTPSEEAALLALEHGLDDDWVVFQKRPVDGFLAAHPDIGLCLVLTADGGRAYDPDAEAWDGADVAGAVRDLKRELEALGQSLRDAPIGGVAFLADTPRPDGDTDKGVVFRGEGPGLAARVSEAARPRRAIGETAIDELIATFSRGGAAYQRGQVTDAQKAWRETAGRGAPAGPTPRPAAEAASAPAAPFAEPAPFAAPALRVDAPPPAVVPQADPVLLQAALAAKEEPKRDVPALPDIEEDDPLILLLRQAVETVAQSRPLFVAGVQVTPHAIVQPDFLLPALLMAAAEDWSPVVATHEGKGGFLVRLRSDPDAVTGYRVAALTPSTPFLMLLPIVDRLKRSLITEKGEFDLDGSVRQFMRWLTVHRFDTEMIADIDVRVALIL
jgi:hypothetical protein